MARRVGADRERWLALYVLCLGMLMIVLDVTVVNVALPNIQNDLGFSNSGLAWVVNAYLISFGGFLMLAGRVGDLVGRHRIFMIGLAVFVLASLACGLAESQGVLIAARFVQGLGGAMTSSVILGMIVSMFPRKREQAKAIGIFAFVASAGGAVGLLAGGVLTQVLNWHWIFFVNLPIGVVTAIAARRLVPVEEGIGLDKGADVPGAALITGAVMLGVFAIVKPAAEQGWTAPRTLEFGIGALVLLAAFVAREATAHKPLMPLEAFRSRNVVGANLIQALSAAGMFGMFFLGALYLQRVLHDDPLQIGLAFLPVAVVMGALSVKFSEGLVTRYGGRAVCLPGLVLVAGALIMFAQVPVGGSYVVHVLPAMLLFGVGGGLLFPAVMGLAMSDATDDDAGFASGLINTTGQVGGALGLAIMATLSSTRTAHLTQSGSSHAAALVGGYHFAFWIAAAMVGGSVVVAATVLVPVEDSEDDLDDELDELDETDLLSA